MNNTYKLAVIKIGTNALSMQSKNAEPHYGMRPNIALIEKLTSQIATLVHKGLRCVIVTSGAVGFGAAELKLSPPIQKMALKQACAALGQPRLMQEYRSAFAKHDLHCAQLLVTREELNKRLSYNYLAQCIELLLERNIIPVINENDTIAVEELENVYGDNDRLASSVAAKMGADILLLLSDVSGYYSTNPTNTSNANKPNKPSEPNKQANKAKQNSADGIQNNLTNTIYTKMDFHDTKAHIKKLEQESQAAIRGSNLGSGGILTKLHAALAAQLAGCDVILAAAFEHDVITRALLSAQHEVGTLFLADKTRSRKQSWIAAAKPKGILEIDEGALRAVANRKSLLMVGVRASEGNYQRGDVLSVGESLRIVTLLSSDEITQLLAQVPKQHNTIVARADDIVFL